MTFTSSLVKILPQKFFGVIPLYIGVELILGVAILNKAGGVYGILSLLTGHPINFWQWLYNFLNIVVLPFYISGIINMKNRANNARKISMACLVYVTDTFLGLMYTLYFIYFWFSREDSSPTTVPGSSNLDQVSNPVPGTDSTINAVAVGVNAGLDKRDATVGQLSSQSASPGRELFLTISTILVVTAVRFYSTLVVVSFTRALLKQDANAQRYDSSNDDEDTANSLRSNSGLIAKIKFQIYKLEITSKEVLRNFFN